MRIVPVPCLKDNYAYLVIADSGETAVVDASETPPVVDALKREGAVLRAIWSTHHHWDHVGGNEEIAALAREGKVGRANGGSKPLEIVGHTSDASRVPGLTRGVDTGDTVSVG